MVRSSKDPLDHAYYWYWNLRLRPYDLLVRTDFSRRLIYIQIADPIPSLPITLYLIDSFTYAASVTSAATSFRKCVLPKPPTASHR